MEEAAEAPPQLGRYLSSCTSLPAPESAAYKMSGPEPAQMGGCFPTSAHPISLASASSPSRSPSSSLHLASSSLLCLSLNTACLLVLGPLHWLSPLAGRC